MVKRVFPIVTSVRDPKEKQKLMDDIKLFLDFIYR